MKEIKIPEDLFDIQQKSDAKLLFANELNKIVLDKFWDSHGTEVDYGRDEINYNNLVNFQIIEKEMVMKTEYLPDYEYTEWELLVNGKVKELSGEICAYDFDEDEHTLYIHLCIGAG